VRNSWFVVAEDRASVLTRCGDEGSSGVVKADVNHRTYVRAFIRVER
jgi:hypothetical protein